jgi:hypothetical protein
MKDLRQLLDKKKLRPKAALDDRSVFYVFSLVIKEEYGKQGVENVKAMFFKDRKIFIKTAGSIWASEIWTNRKHIVKRVNEQLGTEEITDLAMSQ